MPDSNGNDTPIINCWSQIGSMSSDRSCEMLLDYGHCRDCPTYRTSSKRLLDRPLTDAYRSELTNAYEQTAQDAAKPSHSTFIFRAGDEWLGIRSALVQEVLDMRPIHTIPHKSTRIFRGLVNIRGRLELCVSIGGVLRIEPGRKNYNFSAPERLIVATRAGQSVVFPVSQVHGPHHYEPDDIRPLPVAISGSRAVYTEGVLRLPDKDVGILDDHLLFRNLARNLS